MSVAPEIELNPTEAVKELDLEQQVVELTKPPGPIVIGKGIPMINSWMMNAGKMTLGHWDDITWNPLGPEHTCEV